jgi:hypothetical protein
LVVGEGRDTSSGTPRAGHLEGSSDPQALVVVNGMRISPPPPPPPRQAGLVKPAFWRDNFEVLKVMSSLDLWAG